MFAACTYEEIEKRESMVKNKEIVVFLFVKPSDTAVLQEFEYIHYNSAKYCSVYAIGYTDDFTKANIPPFRKVDCHMKNDWAGVIPAKQKYLFFRTIRKLGRYWILQTMFQ